MFSRVSIVFVFLVMLSCSSHAQVNLDTGMFLGDPDQEDLKEPYSFKFRGSIDGSSPGAGVSVRVGSMIFGLETLGASDIQTGSVLAYGSDGSTMSSGFVSSVGPTHRAMMGVRLSRNIAFYGFHGLAGYSLQHDLSYNSSSNVEHTEQIQVQYSYTETRTGMCGKKYQTTLTDWRTEDQTITATHMSSGFNSDQFNGLQNSVGAGVEAFLFGGVLRVEYNLVHTNGFSQSAKLSHTSNNAQLQNINDQETYNFEWKGSTEQLLQLRWKASF
ncbi:MAG: hypothetical protein ACRBBN_12230 [Methyloligellaceae bacterium]